MEENMNGGFDHHEERSDYAGNHSENSGYSSEGRKLRHRRKVNADVESGPHSYGGPRNYSSDNRPSYGAKRPYGQGRPSYGEGRPSYGERKPYGQGRPSYGDRKPYGQGRPSYGEGRPNFDNDRKFGEGRPSYGERKPYGQGRPSYGESRPRYGEGHSRFGNNNESGFGEGRPSYGERKPYGQGRPSFGDRKPYGQGRPSFGPRKSYGNDSQEGGERKSYVRKPYGQGRPGYGSKFQGNGSYGHKGGKKPYNRDYARFTANDEAEINQMLSGKPQVSDVQLSDNDMAPTPIKEEIRLNKFIANSGVCSRREADDLIQAGVVTVNGEVVTELGTKVNVLKDDVRFNGEPLKGEPKVYIVMNKQKGYVTSASDPHAEKTVMDLLRGCKTRVFPVGRLDKNTTGVLMFTNDGDIAEQLTHPQYNKKKIYQVILDKPLEEADKEKILTVGLDLSDGNIKADELEYIDAEDHRRLGIEIHSGKNRIVRRIFESLGYDVKALDRVYFAGLTKKGLKKGEWRYLSEGEVNVLKMGAYV